ncbi:MAG TPA: GNAT family N-acetyltransferase [Mobilitalea sp.]|nr:GNAT family N-acetyltransferase [Mobilitalea sp.]
MSYEIRSMWDDDLEECARVIREGFLTVAKDFGLTQENCPTNGAFIQKERLAAEKEKGHMMYGMMDGKKIIGYMQLEKNTKELYFLQKLVVLPEYRHKGLGKKLLNYAKELVKGLGGSRISISIIEENKVLKNWYIAYGFTPTGTRKFEHLPFTVGFMEITI